jgi:hypothetical protein
MFSWITPQHIRTYVPALVGSALSYLLQHDTLAHNFFNTLNKDYPGWHMAIETAVTGGVISIYYTGARWLGKKNPKLEKLLLGASIPAQV